MAKIKIVVKGDKADAGIEEQKMILKGYQVTNNVYSQAVVDGTALGGHLDMLEDIDGEIYVIIGTKVS